MSRINRTTLQAGLSILAPIAVCVSMFRSLQSSSAEMVQNVVIAILAIVAFWLLFTFVGSRSSLIRSAVQEWLAILYLWIMGVFVGLYFGVRKEQVDLGQLYFFIAITMLCAFVFYDATDLPLVKRRRDRGGGTSQLKD